MVALEQVTTFRFGRNIASGDFDGDGVPDLVVAGSDDPDLGQPITGAVYARGLGDGTFERKGNTPEVGLYREDGKIKPVFSLEPFRRVGDTKDSVAVTWEGASTIWVLSKSPVSDELFVEKALSWWSNGDNSPYPVDSLAIGTLTQPIDTGPHSRKPAPCLHRGSPRRHHSIRRYRDLRVQHPLVHQKRGNAPAESCRRCSRRRDLAVFRTVTKPALQQPNP